MHARRLKTPEEKLQYHINGSLCFHGAIDPEKRLEELRNAENSNSDLWGAFNDDGEITATMCNNIYTMNFDGQEVLISGIGGVATPPEHRYGGAVKHIFAQLLPAARADGQIFSFLQPFNHSFYRRFGYELCHIGYKYRLSSDMLRGFVHSGWVKPYREGASVEPYLNLYNDMAKKYSLTVVRNEKLMKKHLFADGLSARLNNPNASRGFSYLIGEFEEPLAYVSFSDIRNDPAAKMAVSDCAFAGRKGLYAMLGFLARFTADYGQIILHLPENICLPALLDESPYPPKFECESWFGYMGRVLNVPEALRLMKKPADCRFVIAVQDEYLPANDGNYLVTADGVEKTDLPEDIFVTIQGLSSMIFGMNDLAAAEMRPDVEIISNRKMLEHVFVKKPQFVTEFF